MRSLAELELAARTALAPFRDPACSAAWQAISLALRPRVADYERVFAARVVPAFREHFEVQWASAPLIAPGPAETELEVQLRWSQDVSREPGWPRGYRRLSEYLVPDLAWARFRFCKRGEQRGLAFDGLVFVEDRWVWFPRPWHAAPRTDAFSHWID